MPDELEALQDRTFASLSQATKEAYPAERRLGEGRLAAYLDRRRYGVIGTTRRDGRPHSALSSYRRRGVSFWLPTVAGAQRAGNIAGRGWATLTVYQGDGDDHIAVIVEGPAAVVAPGDVPREVGEAESGEWISQWIRIDAERVISYAAPGAVPG